MSETKTKNLCTVPAADLTDSQYFIAEDGGELKRIPKAQVVLKKLEDMLATDTENLAGGGEVTAQELLDALAEQVANKLLAKSQVVNNLLATVEGNPLDATQGKALKELIDTTNNNLSNRIPFETKVEESSIASRIILMQKAGYKAAVFCAKDTCSDNPPTTGWYNILYWGLSNEQIILASCTWQPKTTYYGVFNLDETAPTITWREIVTKSDLIPIQKGSTFLEDIGSLSSPSQLKHAGFYKLSTMTADVNADAGTETMTEYTTGDFYGLLLGSNINTTDGCEYGTLIVSSPRIRSAIWVGSIWQKKFISWYKIGKS